MFWGLGVWGSGVWVFRVFKCSSVQVFTCREISKDQKGDQGGGQKMAKISGGVKPGHLLEGGQKMAKISGAVKPGHL